METVTAGIPTKDGCPVLTRLQAFIVDQGIVVKLQETIRDRQGRAKDLSAYVPAPHSESGSDSDSDGVQDGTGRVLVRIREFLGTGVPQGRDKIWELYGEVIDAAAGIVTCDLIKAVVSAPGIYEINWGVLNADGDVVISTRGLLSVERSLFGSDSGPPTIQEIRMLMMDSAPSENLLLEEVEFSDEQICLAITRPIQQWNESPPPIETFNTRTFPFRGAWVTGILAELYRMSAAHYRRNRLASSAAGVETDTKNKEREYLNAAQELEAKFSEWLLNKKVSINMKKFAGESRSSYSTRTGW